MRCVFPVGRLSLLIGVHHVICHPVTVMLAWRHLYGCWPSWREVICIVVHDWGYWSCTTIDGEDGKRHPELGAQIAGRLLGPEYRDLCLYHSRHYARASDRQPSRLCYADKLSIRYEPWWFYLARAWASGELAEYRMRNAQGGYLCRSAHYREWFTWVRGYLIDEGLKGRSPTTPKAGRLHGESITRKPSKPSTPSEVLSIIGDHR